MKTIKDYYAVVLTSKWFYLSILATVVSYIALDDLGLRTRRKGIVSGYEMCKSNIYALLTNPFYYGWFEYPQKSGLWFKGKHEPMITSEDAFDTALHAQKWFANGGPKSRRDIFMSLGSNFTLKGQKLSVELEFPFQVIAKNKRKVELEIREVLTSKNRVTVKQLLECAQLCPLLCTGQDSNRF